MEWRLTSIIQKTTSRALYPRFPIRTVVNLSFKILSESTTDQEIPILLFHDLLSSKKHWEGIGKTIFALTKRPVIAVDLRNHGDSSHSKSHKYTGLAKDILQLLTKLDIDKASLVGHSMGGMAAMCVALMSPEKVAGILIVDISPVSTATPMIEYYPKVLSAMKKINFKGFRKLRKARKAARKELKFIINDDVVLQDVLANINILRDGTIGWKCNLDVLTKNLKYISSFPTKTFKGKRYLGPVLFVGGQQSDFIPPDDLPAIREIFPQAVITYVSGAGHNLHVDDPKTFLEFVIAFVRQH